ncbi:hypothetical protein ACFV9C_41565 [Kribbella sp. NPDC059898]|uniref:hypothetical protein n=1 Tax=Kribbella sp. NPDC059898 TaxID=3346995 RepID=UPI003661BD7A
MSRSYLKDAARRRARRSGDSYQQALQALTRFDQPRPDQQHNPDGIDWSPLYGVEVSFSNDHHRLRGVVLPPDGVRPGDAILRVAVTDPRPGGPVPAQVTYLDARWWDVDPMPDRVHQRFLPSQRLTQGVLGLPLYRVDNLPAAALATKTMLKRQYRLRPADDQRPVAEYYAMKDYYPLYAIDDAERMPALPPDKQAAWHKVRTCALCGKQQHSPYHEAQDGGRYCQDCYPLAADEWWDSRLGRAQELAIDWARELVEDPNAVVAGVAGWPVTRLAVVEISTGEVLHNLTAEMVDDSAWPLPAADDPIWDAAVPREELAAIMNTLAERRIISWGSGLQPIAERLMRSSHLPGSSSTDASAWIHTSADSAWNWYAYWLNERASEPYKTFRWASSWNTTVQLRCPPRLVDEYRGDGAGLLEQCLSDLEVLRAMAAGPPTSEQRERARKQPARISRGLYSSTLAKLTDASDVSTSGDE